MQSDCAGLATGHQTQTHLPGDTDWSSDTDTFTRGCWLVIRHWYIYQGMLTDHQTLIHLPGDADWSFARMLNGPQTQTHFQGDADTDKFSSGCWLVTRHRHISWRMLTSHHTPLHLPAMLTQTPDGMLNGPQIQKSLLGNADQKQTHLHWILSDRQTWTHLLAYGQVIRHSKCKFLCIFTLWTYPARHHISDKCGVVFAKFTNG